MEAFEAPIVASDGGGAYVEVPADVVKALGDRRRIPVQATFDGVTYRGSVVSMGGDAMVLGVLKEIRSRLGKAPGDVVRVTLDRDDATRTVVVPDDLAAALEAGGARAAFDRLSYTHQREYVNWIAEAKKPETRRRRISESCTRLQGSP